MLFEQLINTLRILEGGVFLGIAVGIHGKGPLGFVVCLCFGVVTDEDTVVEFVIVANDKGSVGVMDHVFLESKVVVQNVLDHATEDGDIGTGTDACPNVGFGRGPGVTRIDVDQGCALFLRPGHPFEGDGMVFGSVTAHYKNAIRVLEIDPVIGHRAASERLCQSRNSCAVSNTRLMLNIHQAEAAEHCLVSPALLVVESGRT